MLQAEARELAHRVWLVDANGELDHATASRLSDLLDEVASEAPAAVAVDLNGVTFMDSSGAIAIVRAKRQLDALGARLAILRPHPMPRSFFRRTNLDRLIAIVDSLDDVAPSEQGRAEATRMG